MAKKKKDKMIKLEENKPIIYTGKVILKKVKNGKIISSSVQHNNGSYVLFNFLLSCLAGKYDTKLKPNYITPILKTSTDGIYKYATYNVCTDISDIKLSAGDSSKIPYVEYNFYLSNKNDYQVTGIDGLALYCEKYAPDAMEDVNKGDIIADNYSMIVLFDENQKLSENEGLIVVWQLSVINNN